MYHVLRSFRRYTRMRIWAYNRSARAARARCRRAVRRGGHSSRAAGATGVSAAAEARVCRHGDRRGYSQRGPQPRSRSRPRACARTRAPPASVFKVCEVMLYLWRVGGDLHMGRALPGAFGGRALRLRGQPQRHFSLYPQNVGQEDPPEIRCPRKARQAAERASEATPAHKADAFFGPSTELSMHQLLAGRWEVAA